MFDSVCGQASRVAWLCQRHAQLGLQQKQGLLMAGEASK